MISNLIDELECLFEVKQFTFHDSNRYEFKYQNTLKIIPKSKGILGCSIDISIARIFGILITQRTSAGCFDNIIAII